MAYVEQTGIAFLKLVDNVYTIEADDGDVPLMRADGATPFEDSVAYSFSHVEPASDGGYVTVMNFPDGTVSLRWFNEAGTLVNWTGRSSGDSYLAQEAELNLDINGDGQIEAAEIPEVVVESAGNATLKLVDNVYTVSTPSGDVALARPNGGAPFSADAGYEFTHVEPASEGGYVAVMNFPDGTVSLRWFNETGTLVNWTGRSSSDSYLAQEAALNLDINGDGQIEAAEIPEVVVESAGNATLKLVDNVYTVSTPSGDVALARPNGGAPFSADAGYEFTHVEPASEGGYVAVMNFPDGTVSLRWFNETGTLVNWTGRSSSDSYLAQEAALNLDINGDGQIEAAEIPEVVVESAGNATLKLVDNVYTVSTPSGDVALARPNGGAPFSADAGYEFTHVEPASEGGYVAVMNFPDGTVSLRWFNETGTLVNWTGRSSSDSYLAQEAALNLDINGDGQIEAAEIPEVVVESAGNATLKLVDNVYTVSTPSGDVALARPNGGAPFSADAGYEFTHVEPASEGGYVAVMNFPDGTVSLRWFNETGTLVNWTGRSSGDSYLDREADLNLDINGDGQIEAAEIPEVVVESAGNATLKLVDNVYTVSTPSGDVALARPNGGAPFSADAGYEFTHVEPASDGGYVAVMNFPDGTVSLRWFNETGTLVNWTGRSSGDSYLDREADLNLDINGDGQIEAAEIPEVVVESAGNATLKLVDNVYTVSTPSGDVALARPNGGAPFSADAGYEFTHVEPASDGGYVAVMNFPDGTVSLRWFNETGTLVNWTGRSSGDSYLDREADLNLDINGDGQVEVPNVINTIESEGSAILKTVNGEYQVEVAGTTVALTDGGQPLADNSGYTLTHAEPKDEGFVAVKQLTNGNIALMYFSAAGVLASETAEGAAASFVEQELAIGIDLNGDGILSEPVVDPQPGEIIDTLGNASLQLTNDGYVLVVGNSVTPILDENGQQLRSSGSFTLERFADTGASDEYVIVGEQPSDNEYEYEFFILDVDGNLVEHKGPMPELAAQAYELDLQIEFTGDGIIGRGPGALGGVTTELSGDWANEGAIRGDGQGNDIIINNLLPEGTTLDSWVDIHGGAGDDILVGGNGENFFFGGEGDDVFYAGDRALNGENPGDQEAVYVFDGRGSQESPWAGVSPSDGILYVEDDQGSLMRIFMDGENGWVKDLTTGVGGYGKDTLIGVQSVYIQTDGGQIEIGFDADTGEYVFQTQDQQYVEVETNEWGMNGEIGGTNNAETIDVSDHPAFSEFGDNDWIDIQGYGGDDVLVGHTGSNWIEGGKGNDEIHGNFGYDTAAYELADLSDYSISLDYRDNNDGTLTVTKNGIDVLLIQLKPDNTGTVTDLRPGPENLGTDTLTGIQAIEVEGMVDELKIEITDEGYKVSGTRYPDISTDPWNGYLEGTQFSDELIVGADNGFDPAVFDQSSYVSLIGGGGDDILTGHVGSNWFEGGAGDDQIDGGAGAGWDTANYSSLDETAFYPFWDSEEGVDFWYREENNGSITVFVNGQDLYSVNLSGEGWVEDLWAVDGDTGYDTVENINGVRIETAVGTININYQEGFGYNIDGGYRNVPYAESWGGSEGSGNIFGSGGGEVLNAANFVEVDSSNVNAFIRFEGRGGNDQLIGGASYDTASYFSDYEIWESLFGEDDEFGYNPVNIAEFDFRDNGDGTITVYANGQDLYHVALDAQGNGFVEDLWAADNDSGRDTLTGIDSVEISIPNGSTMNITVLPSGEYQVSGFIADRPYAEGYGDGSGFIYGSTEDDVLNAADFTEVDASNEFATIDFQANEGDDVMTGHAGSNSFSTGYNDGNDTMNGGAGYDSVYYSNYDDSAYEQFTSVGRWSAGVRDNGGDNYTLYVNDVDLFSVVFDANYNATVTDLWLEDGYTGVDQLNDIEHIWFDGPVSYASFNIDPGVSVSSYADDRQPDVIVNEDGTASIIGTGNRDYIVVNDYAELDLSPASTVTIEGGYGDDVIIGHDGANILVGGDGNDFLDGAGGDDTAVYNSQYYGGSDGAPEISVLVDGSNVTIGTSSLGDLYQINLDSQYARDAVGDTPQEASVALTVGNGVRSAFESQEDVDMYAVAVEAGQTYVIRGRGDYTDGQGSDPRILDVSDEFGDHTGERVTNYDENVGFVQFTSNSTGTVYVSVESGYGPEFGNYTLEVLPQALDAAAEIVEVPSDYISAVAVEDVGFDNYFEGFDYVANTEHFEFNIDNGSGDAAVVTIDQTDIGYDILVNGVKQDDVLAA